jgi:hypothetical protein
MHDYDSFIHGTSQGVTGFAAAITLIIDYMMMMMMRAIIVWFCVFLGLAVDWTGPSNL